MKRINGLSGISCVLLLSAPLLLAGCEGIESPFGNSQASSNYDNYDYNKANAANAHATKGTTGNIKGHPSATTTLVEPGVSTVKNPKATSTTTSTVPLEAPMVPGVAPSVGQ
jgi:hypothetical protein